MLILPGLLKKKKIELEEEPHTDKTGRNRGKKNAPGKKTQMDLPLKTTSSPFLTPLTFLNQQHSRVKRIKWKGAKAADRGIVKGLRISALKL